MTNEDPPSPSTVKRAQAVRNATKELRILSAKRTVRDALATRNGPTSIATLNLPLLSDVRVYREKDGWQGPYKLISMEGETCTLQMPYGPAKFRSIVVKPYLTNEYLFNPPAGLNPTTDLESLKYQEDLETIQELEDSTIIVDVPQELQMRRRRGRPRKDSTIHMTFLSHKEQGDMELSLRLRKEGVIKTAGAPFEAAIKAEIDGLMASNVFKIVKYDPAKNQDI